MDNKGLIKWEAYNLNNTFLPTSKIWKQIDWSKVFDRIRVSYQKPINWNLRLDKNWKFSERNFIMWDLFTVENKNKLFEEAEKLHKTIAYYKENAGNDRIFYYDSLVHNLIKLFQGIYFLWNQDKNKWEVTNVYVQNFFIKLEELNKNLKNQWSLSNEPNSDVIESIDNEIIMYVNEWIEWVKKMWWPYENETIEKFKELASIYIKPWNILDVDKVLETLSSHWSWNEYVLIFAFYIAKCSKKELERLQNWVLIALDSKFKKLDTTKIFSILEFVLPYIYEWIDDINFDFPEIFRPEFLSKIHIYDLTIEGFTNQIYHIWKENNWSPEIQARLIEQFKKYWASKKWEIWFWQWSEQLFYWIETIGHINKDNYTQYLKSDDLWEDKRPLPNILKCSVEERVQITSDSTQKLIGNS